MSKASTTINPSYPMSQFQNFHELSEKRSGPFKMTRDYPHFHKIVLRCEDRIAGDKINAQFRVNLLANISKTAVLHVDSFTIWGAPAPIGADTPYTVSIPELHQPKTYDTATGGTTDFLFQSNSIYYQNQISTSSLGTPITDPNFFNNVFTVQIREQLGSDIEPSVGGWILVLHVYEVSNSEISG